MSKHNREKRALYKNGITQRRLGRCLTYAQLQKRYKEMKQRAAEKANES